MASKIKIPYTVEPWFYDDELPQAQKKLEAAGLADLWVPVGAKKNQLQIDVDHKSAKVRLPSNFKGMMGLLQQRFSLQKPLPFRATKSKGQGTHIVINLPIEIDDVERIAWQAAFGSDGKREALNLLRVRRNIKNPILLFMPKEDIVSVGNTARRIKE